MIRCIIIDDEKPAIRVLQKFIRQLPDIELVASSNDPTKGIELVNLHQPDVLFLDIQMDHLDGIELAKLVGNRCKIIFCTAFEGYAAQSYDVNAVDYLLKPIELPRFKIAVQKLSDLLTGSTTPVEAIQDDYIMVRVGDKGNWRKLDIDDIVFVKSLNNYVVFHCPPHKVLSYLSLKDLEDRLPLSAFVRVHKSYIVSIKSIEIIDQNVIQLKNNGPHIPIGASYRDAFLRRMLGRRK